MKVAILPGDGIGPEIIAQAIKVLRRLEAEGLRFTLQEAPIGGAGVDAADDPLPPATFELAQQSDAILFGCAGAPKYEHLPRTKRPGLGLLKLRKGLSLYANLRPSKLLPELIGASPLRPEIVGGMDITIVRELNGDIYFGEPRGRVENERNERECINTMRYTESEIARVAHVAFRLARTRKRKLLSVDKANVLETMVLWREVVSEVASDYPDVELSHMYVDAAAMALMRAPTRYDVVLTPNLFGDILSDELSMMTGSIGLAASASLGDDRKGLYEPIHGSAPDIAGQNLANPIAMILSTAMMLRHSFDLGEQAERIEAAVTSVLATGIRTADIQEAGLRTVGTEEMGDAIAAAL